MGEEDVLIRYAIRHTLTGGYLPEVGKSYTASEPTDMKMNSSFSPRLFAESGHAKRALTWWLKGVTTKTYYAGSWEHGEDADERWETHTPESGDRKREDFKIVRVTMVCEVMT